MKFQNYWVLAFFLGWNFFLRYFTFHYSTLDWDEITYLVIAKGILKGKIPYVDLWDLKPVGSFLLYSISILFFGYSTETVRIVSWVFSSILGFGIFLLLKKENFFIAFISGVICLYFFLVFPSGLSGNTELLFTPIEVFGLYFILQKEQFKNAFGFFLLGIAFIIKYIIVFDLLWFLVYYIFQNYDKKKSWFILLSEKKAIFLTLVPFFIVVLFYLFSGHINNFLHVTFGVAQKHKQDFNILATVKFLWELGKFFLLVNLGFIFFLVLKRQSLKQSLIYFLWVLTSSLGAIWTQFLYEHYLLACVPSWILLTAKLGTQVYEQLKTSIVHSKTWMVLGTLLLGSFIILSVQRKNWLSKVLNRIPDEQKELSLYLKEKNPKSLFVSYGYHSTYVLLDLLPVVKLVQPNNYTEEIFARNFQVDLNELFKEISQIQVEWIQWCGEISPYEITKEYSIQKGIYFEYILKLKEFLKDYQLIYQTKQTCKLFKKKYD